MARSKRRLAGAVGADQRDDLALVDGERDLAHGLQEAVAHVEPVDGEQAHVGAAPEIGVDDGGVGHHRPRDRRRR